MIQEENTTKKLHIAPSILLAKVKSIRDRQLQYLYALINLNKRTQSLRIRTSKKQNGMITKTTPVDDIYYSSDPTAAPASLGYFDIEEIQIGSCLGTGGSSSVYEITAFRPNDTTGNTKRKAENNRAREFMTKHARRHKTGQTRYAIKFLQEKWIHKTEQFKGAATDLAAEADILSSVDHPNILKIRGIATDGIDAYTKKDGLCHDGFFLILDRLDETLEDRIKSWKKQTKKLNSPVMKELRRNIRNEKRRRLLLEKLKVAYDIASSLEYLHSKNMIHRDLKSANIGFDEKDAVKLFDFGLCREMPNHNGNATRKDTFQMSGKVGTLRYMANELARRQPYNQKVDCYSFAHVFWEMLSTEKPYKCLSKEEHKTRVTLGEERPFMNMEWPMDIQILLEKAWHPDYESRPTMTEIKAIIRKELVTLQKGHTTGPRQKKRQPSIVLQMQQPPPASFTNTELGIDMSILSQSVRTGRLISVDLP